VNKRAYAKITRISVPPGGMVNPEKRRERENQRQRERLREKMAELRQGLEPGDL